MLKKLLAYHGKEEIKIKYLNRVKQHMELDNLIQGIGWEDGKGCAVGCTLENYQHSQYPIELGIPEEIAHLEDCIFEGLTNGDAKRWPELFLASIKEGADLSLVWPKFTVELLSNKKFGVLQYVQKEEFKQQKDAINNVLDLYLEWVMTEEKPLKTRWAAARAAAGAARAAGAAGAAWAAWAAWAARAARDAAGAARAAWAAWAAGAARAAGAAGAAGAARDAAWAAWAAWAARAEFWLWARDTLIKLLKEPSND